MTILQSLRSLRQSRPIGAAEIRRELLALQQQHAITVQQRSLLALDAVNDDAAAARWSQLGDTVQVLAQRIDVLASALPQAEAKEAEAARQIEATARTKRMHNYQRQTAEAQAWLDGVLASLPSGEQLTQARTLRDVLREEARGLSQWSHDAAIRRPLDPLEVIHAALALRVARMERARWIGSHPITLSDKQRAS